MPKPETLQFITYLDGLIAATRSRAIAWTRINPSTFSWTAPPPAQATLNLQVVETSVRRRDRIGLVQVETVTHFVFQAFDLAAPPNTPQRLRLSISSADAPEVKPKLQELYDSIQTGLSQDGLDFLRSVVPPS
jgi:hypothetical protein